MKYHKIVFILIAFMATNLYAMKSNDHSNGDTLVLKGKIVKVDMKTQKGTKSEGVQDYNFSAGSISYFIKTAVGKFTKKDLDAIVDKEITVKCYKDFGNLDIGPEDPSYAATRSGYYVVILEILKQ